MSQYQFLATLFNPDEEINICKNLYDTRPIRFPNEANKEGLYVALNPLHTSRADANITAYRNILLEFDKHSIPKQNDFIERNKIPYSTLVYSGSKSLHCIVALNEGLTNREEYDELVDKLYFLLDPDNKWLDKSCKNPSRLTRLADVIRPDTGKLQNLMDIRPRISLSDLYKWMQQHKNYPTLFKYSRDKIIKEDERKQQRFLLRSNNLGEGHNTDDTNIRFNKLSRRAEAFLTYGPSASQNWRTEAMFACCDLARCGFEEQEIYDYLLNVDGFLNEDSERIPSDSYNLVLTSGELGIRLLEDEGERHE